MLHIGTVSDLWLDLGQMFHIVTVNVTYNYIYVKCSSVLIAISEVNEMLVLLAQIIVLFLYILLFWDQWWHIL